MTFDLGPLFFLRYYCASSSLRVASHRSMRYPRCPYTAAQLLLLLLAAAATAVELVHKSFHGGHFGSMYLPRQHQVGACRSSSPPGQQSHSSVTYSSLHLWGLCAARRDNPEPLVRDILQPTPFGPLCAPRGWLSGCAKTITEQRLRSVCTW